MYAHLRRAGAGVPASDNNTLRLVELGDCAVRQLEVLLDERGRREREPLREADVLEPVRVEDLEEAQRRVARVLDVVACAEGQLTTPIL